MIMKACITGVTGFIGVRLASWLREQGYEVLALGLVNNDIEEERKRDLENSGVTVVISNVTEPVDKLAELIKGCDVVFHLAAAQHEANVPDQYFRDVNIEGTRNMLDASIKAGVKRFVHGSTIGVYGDAMDGELDELSRLAPSNIYGLTKLEGEELALSYNDKLPVVAIRISETYGPGDRRLLKLFKGLKKRTFFMVGNGFNAHQLIFIDDLVEGIVKAAETDGVGGEVFVLAGDEVLTTEDMCRIVGLSTSSPPPALRFPMGMFVFLAIACEKVFKPLGMQPPLHRRRLDFFRKSFYFDTSKAKNKLNFSPGHSFSAGTKICAEWYQSKGLL
jgi:nucleoside-diphosphate-sugar epimerase